MPDLSERIRTVIDAVDPLSFDEVASTARRQRTRRTAVLAMAAAAVVAASIAILLSGAAHPVNSRAVRVGPAGSSATTPAQGVPSGNRSSPATELLDELVGVPPAGRVAGDVDGQGPFEQAVVVRMTWAEFQDDSHLLNGQFTTGGPPPGEQVYVVAALRPPTITAPTSVYLAARQTTPPFQPIAVSPRMNAPTLPAWVLQQPILSRLNAGAQGAGPGTATATAAGVTIEMSLQSTVVVSPGTDPGRLVITNRTNGALDLCVPPKGLSVTLKNVTGNVSFETILPCDSSQLVAAGVSRIAFNMQAGTSFRPLPAGAYQAQLHTLAPFPSLAPISVAVHTSGPPPTS